MLKKSLAIILALLFLLIILSGCIQQQGKQVYIENVIDGDTVKTAAGDSIRLLGVDTPEIDWENGKHEFYAQKAKDFTVKNLKGKNVDLEYDTEKKDDYGRTLAYIFQNGENFNQKLLEKGYASLMIVQPNDKYESEFKKAVKEARESRKGVWSQILEAEKNLPIISFAEAELYLNQEVIVKGKIVNTAAVGSVNYLNFSNNYQDTLTVVIFNHNLNKFDYQPVDHILNKKIKVLGEIKLYKGSPQIVVDDPYDLEIEH